MIIYFDYESRLTASRNVFSRVRPEHDLLELSGSVADWNRSDLLNRARARPMLAGGRGTAKTRPIDENQEYGLPRLVQLIQHWRRLYYVTSEAIQEKP